MYILLSMEYNGWFVSGVLSDGQTAERIHRARHEAGKETILVETDADTDSAIRRIIMANDE